MIGRWVVRVQAIIDDRLEVEAETEEEALANAFSDWSFIEAHSWESEVVERPLADDDSDDLPDDG